MMKQTFGLGVILAVAVSASRLLGGSQGPIEPASNPAITAPKHVHDPHPKALAQNPAVEQGGCTAFTPEDPKATSVAYPHDPNRGAVVSLLHTFLPLEPSQTLQSQQALHYAIALVPDPKHTNLSLTFDREMVAIQQAAQDEGYTYNSSWLPWSPTTDTFSGLSDQQHAEEATDARESCPGVLLFRHSVSRSITGPSLYSQGLVVLVVGEQPTGGLNQDQWDNAVAWLRRNASPNTPTPRTLPILGPSFSGSLVSLERALTALPSDPRTFPSTATPIHILSGSVSSCSSTLWFQDRLRGAHTSTLFGSFQQNDELQVYRLLNYLDRQGTHPNDVAILSEDETAYASPSAGPADLAAPSPCTFPYARDNRPIRLSYPRDISAVRSAYERQSVFTATSGGRSAHPILQESPSAESEPPAASDTIPAFSGPISPIAQEAILYGIVSYLRAHHTHYLLLRCTNPLDFLFLTRFFHRAYPDGRVVTVGADLLFRREIDTTEFRGVLALSSTPLIPRNQHWSWLWTDPAASHSQPHTHRTPDSQGETVYLAARYLFDGDKSWPLLPQPATALSLPFKEGLPDFADPFWMHSPRDPLDRIQAPTWLASIGRDGYWPLAILNDRSTPDRQLAGSDHLPPPSTIVTLDGQKTGYDLDARRHFDKSLLFFPPVPWWVLLGCASILLLYQTLGVALSGRHTSTGLFAPFRRINTISHLVVLGINSGLAVTIFTGLFAIGAALTKLSPLAHPWIMEFPFLTACALLTLPLFCFLWIQFHPLASLTLAIVALLLNAILFWLVGGSLIHGPTCCTFANDLPLFYRIGHVTGGVSPLVPVMFLLSGFYLWTWQAMAGNSLLCCGRPLLPCLQPDPKATPPTLWRRLRDHCIGLLPNYCASAAARLDRAHALIGEFVATRILRVASPISVPTVVVAPPILLFVTAAIYMRIKDPLLLTLEGSHFTWAVNLALLFAFCLTLAEAARLYLTWVELRRLLTALKRLRLRRTFARLRAVDSDSLWSVSGNVQRIQLLFFSQQLDAATRMYHLAPKESPLVHQAYLHGRQFAAGCAESIQTGPLWENPVAALAHQDEHQHGIFIRELFNDATAELLHEVLIPHWNTELSSLSLETTVESHGSDGPRLPFNMELCPIPRIRVAEEFVCFHYIAFIQVILARMKTMILSMIYLFVSVCFAISFYPFVPRTGIGVWMLIHLLLIASSVIVVYAGMERDETLSYITNSTPGKLNSEFYVKTATFLAGPVIGLLTTQFPAISETLVSWLQPGLDVLK